MAAEIMSWETMKYVSKMREIRWVTDILLLIVCYEERGQERIGHGVTGDTRG